MELTGKIIKTLEPKSGQGQKGEWKLQEYILETQDDYPKKICISVWGDKIDQFGIKEEENITAHFSLESREFNERWYTTVRVWRVERSGQEAQAASSIEAPPPPTEAPPEISDEEAPF